MRRLAYPLFFLLGVAAAYAVLSFLNPVQWRLNATLPPVSKDVNTSLYPLVRGWYTAVDVNATYYYMKFMPGWPEQYVVGSFRAREPGWQARLEAVARAGSPGGTYAISLGGQVQITDVQSGGPYVPTTAPLVWTTTTTSRYSVLARAWFNQGGIYAWQWVNFTAEPMARLYSQTFSCPGYTYTWSWTCTGSQTYSDSLAYSTQPSYISPYLVYDSETVTTPVNYTGTSIRTQIDARTTGYGLSSVIYDVRARWGTVPAAGATVSVSGTYSANSRDTRNNVAYLSVGVDTNGNGVPDLEFIVYVWDTGGGSGAIYAVLVGQGTLITGIDSNGNPTTTPSSTSQYGLIKARSVTSGTSFTINVTLPATLQGNIVKVAFAVVDPSGYVSGSPYGDFWVDWKNLVIQTGCQAPSGVQTYTSGQPYTSVYITQGNKLATEVDANSATGNAASDYGIAAAVIYATFNATGASISTYADYYRGVADSSNNVVYIDVAVDENFDGTIDREYIYYYYDTSYSSGVIVSPFTNQVVCTVSSTGACTPTSRYVVTALGSMSSPQRLTFSITLNAVGAVRAIALVTTDGSYYDQNINGDVYAYWGPVSVTHYSCPLPAGWSGSGTYYWQTNYALFTANAVAYRGLVSGALTYVANFTGVGTYAVFDSALNVVFGVYRGASGFSAVCGSALYALGAFPAARYVELRPLGGLGDVVIRDANGNILARYGCRYTTTPTYIGVKTGAGEAIKLYTLEAWG